MNENDYDMDWDNHHPGTTAETRPAEEGATSTRITDPTTVPIVVLWVAAAVFLLLGLLLALSDDVGVRGPFIGMSLIPAGAVLMTGALVVHALRRR